MDRLQEVLSGDADDLRWIIRAGGDDSNFETFIYFYRRGKALPGGSGFAGPKLYPGQPINYWHGRRTGIPAFVVARVAPDVEKVVMETTALQSITLALSEVVPQFGIRFAAAPLPGSAEPTAIHAEGSDGSSLSTQRVVSRISQIGSPDTHG